MALGTLRAPRAYLAVSVGNIVPIEVSVEMTTYRKSDGFSARVALDGTPGIDEFFWSNLTKPALTVYATNDANQGGYVPLFVGNIDEIDIDWVTRSCRIVGRDMGALLLETKTSEKFQNQTTAQIVQTLAARVGLTANVSVPSSDKVGLIYKTDNARITEQDTLMNVLTRLAQRSGCIFWISGTVLNFIPATAVTGPNYTINYARPTPSSIASGNFVTLRSARSYRLSKNIKVRTKSWQLKQKQGLISEFDMPGSVGGNLVHEYKAPNLTKQQADAFTQQRLNEISSREKTVEISLPGDINLTPENPVILTGTGTAFDQTYIVSRIGHAFSQGGYRMNVSVRNKDQSRTITQSSGEEIGETTAP